MLQIGPYTMPSRVLLAPMAGITDLPFRQLCRRYGAGLAVSEMVTSDSRLWHTHKSRQRLIHAGETEPRAVQIAGSDTDMMAEAARLTVARGAQIIDINMGCPAKKVCKKAAGSALLKDERQVARILSAVTAAVNVPVTLKIRTGTSPDQRNAPAIARLAQDCGIAALAVHGRTRACRFEGPVEYDTIAEIKSTVTIPVIANGDIDSPQKARQVIDYTGADAVMIGRAALGRPWICREIDHYLRSGALLPPPTDAVVGQVLLNHLRALHQFYGLPMGVRIARKHVGWYLKAHCTDERFRADFNRLESAEQQYRAIATLFNQPFNTPTIDPAVLRTAKRGPTRNEEVIAA